MDPRLYHMMGQNGGSGSGRSGKSNVPLGIGGMSFAVPGAGPGAIYHNALTRVNIAKKAPASGSSSGSSSKLALVLPKAKPEVKETVVGDGKGGKLVVPGQRNLLREEEKKILKEHQMKLDQALVDAGKAKKKKFNNKCKKVVEKHSDFMNALHGDEFDGSSDEGDDDESE